MSVGQREEITLRGLLIVSRGMEEKFTSNGGPLKYTAENLVEEAIKIYINLNLMFTYSDYIIICLMNSQIKDQLFVIMV